MGSFGIASLVDGTNLVHTLKQGSDVMAEHGFGFPTPQSAFSIEP
jgi:hypothetical protein